MKKAGHIILLIVIFMIFTGGVGDFVLTLTNSSIPESHVKFLKVPASDVSQNLKQLDNALIRSIGGGMIGVAIGTFALLYLPIRKGAKFSLVSLLLIITIAEGNNSYQMYQVGSPYYVYTLSCVILAWIGAILWLLGTSKNKSMQ